MKKLLPVLFFSLGILLSGCINDYDVESSLADNFEPRVLVNCIISSQWGVSVELEWSRRFDADPEEDPEYIQNATITIMQEDEIIFSRNPYEGGVLHRTPEPGRIFYLTVDVPEYGRLTAQTYLPYPATFEAEFVKSTGDYQHFIVTALHPVDVHRAVWFRISYFYEDNYIEYNRDDFFTDSPVLDKFNSFVSNTDAVIRGSNIVYERFMRIPKVNIPLAEPFQFSVFLPRGFFTSEEWSEEEPPYQYKALEEAVLRLLTPSDDYDKYMRSVYRQMSMGDNGDFASINDNMYVHSNIDNGLGIFAGYSESRIRFLFK